MVRRGAPERGALRRLGLEVVGVLGSRPEKSAAAAQALGLRKGYASYDELLADREVQAVHLAVPNRLHHDMAVQALQAGRHVMCEKPLAMNARESADLVRRAAACGLQAGVCYNIRYCPLNLQAREMGPIVRELAAGIREIDRGPHLITFKPDPAPFSCGCVGRHGTPTSPEGTTRTDTTTRGEMGHGLPRTTGKLCGGQGRGGTA